MAWSISDLIPPWGDSGEKPPDNKDYSGGDRVNEKHFDYLWYAVGQLEDEIRSALTDIDSDGDGVVDEADSANAYKGNDIDSDGDGVVDEADSANAYKGNDIDSDGDGVVDAADEAVNVTSTYKGNDIDSDGDGTVDDADQYDALSPSDGSSGQFLKTDGTTTLWDTITSEWSGNGTLLSPNGSEIGIDVDRIQNKDYKEDHVATTVSTSSHTVDLSSANVHKITMAADVSFSFNSVNTSTSNQVTIYLKQDSTGSRTPSWPSSVRWPDGSEPSWSTAANAIDVVTFLYDPDDDVWDGFVGGFNFS